MSNSLKIFAGTTGKKLAEKIVAYLNIPLGDSSIKYFSDGEIWVNTTKISEVVMFLSSNRQILHQTI